MRLTRFCEAADRDVVAPAVPLPRGKLEHISEILPHVWRQMLPRQEVQANAGAHDTGPALRALAMHLPPAAELIDV
jgi:hypothetical protein